MKTVYIQGYSFKEVNDTLNHLKISAFDWDIKIIMTEALNKDLSNMAWMFDGKVETLLWYDVLPVIFN